MTTEYAMAALARILAVKPSSEEPIKITAKEAEPRLLKRSQRRVEKRRGQRSARGLRP